MGMSCYGVEIYVPSKLLAQANEILAAEPAIGKADIPDEESGKASEKNRNIARRVMAGIIVVVFLLFGIVWGFF